MKSLNIGGSESVGIERAIVFYRQKYGIDNGNEVDLQWIRAIEYISLLYGLILAYTDNYSESTHTEYAITSEGKIFLFCCIDLGKEGCSWSDFQDKAHNCYDLFSSYAPCFDLILGYNYGNKGGLRIHGEKTMLLSQKELDDFNDAHMSWTSLYHQLRIINKGKKERGINYLSYANEMYGLGIQYYEDYNSKIAKKNLGDQVSNIYTNLSPLLKDTFAGNPLSAVQNNNSSSFSYNPDLLHQNYKDRIQKDEERIMHGQDLIVMAGYDSVEEMLEDESMIVKFDTIEGLSHYKTICGDKDAYSLGDMINYLQTKKLLPHQYTLIGIVDKNEPLLISLVILNSSSPINIDGEYIEELVKNKGGSLIYNNHKSGGLFFISE